MRHLGDMAFAYSSITGELTLPANLEYLGKCAFYRCESIYGELHLPDKLTFIGMEAFSGVQGLTGGITIPKGIKEIETAVFYNCRGLNGTLTLHEEIAKINQDAFFDCSFRGELVLPKNLTIIDNNAFSGACFSGSLSFPNNLVKIGDRVFEGNSRLCGTLQIPESLIKIGANAFSGCSMLEGIILPNNCDILPNGVFNGCFNINTIVCNNPYPPKSSPDAFAGVPKDNFTVEVPESAVAQYQTAKGWNEFKRIAAYRNLVIRPSVASALNTKTTRELILDADDEWEVESMPGWVTLSQKEGKGKTLLKLEFLQMPKGKNREGDLVIKLKDKDYRTTCHLNQYDYDYAEDEIITLRKASKGNGINLVFLGDGFSAKDISEGLLMNNVQEAAGHFFSIEPYKTYKDYFNVYAVVSMSDESGVGTVNTIIDNKFGSYFTQNRLLAPKAEECFEWAKKANSSMDLTKSLVIMLQNTSTYEGVTMMYGDGSAIACCPVSKEAYPYDFRGLIQHEAGGHGFGKLADEYIYHNAFIQTCSCQDGCDHPSGDDDLGSSFGFYKSKGWYRNLTMNGDAKQAPWSHLIYNSKYSNRVDMYEGGYMHSRGVYRSEATSCMNNNIPYYSSISRQAIVERIKEYAGETFSLDDFYTNDVFDFGTITKSAASVDGTFGVDSKFHRATGHAPVYMGEHPNVK
ncbi:MAG TPA: hypothetical protein DD383_06360 [Rikenellaceae bacterium]|nr:hypothetical protein [Rikenellaceae bacterium]